MKIRLALFLSASLGMGCDTSSAEPTAPTPEVAHVDTAASASLDLNAVIERVRLAYRPDGSAYVGGDGRYRARVEEGRLQLVPLVQSSTGPIEGTALRLHTVDVRRGEDSLTATPSETRSGADGGLRIDRGPTVEHLRNTVDGVEQSWSFDVRPPGEGDLRVRVAAEGLELKAATASGLHFAAEGLGFRYGHGTWIDAAGHRQTVPARWVGGAIELRVPAELVERSAYPAVLDPVIGPETAVDVPVPGLQYGGFDPAVASDGAGTSLVLWEWNGIVGTRVDSSGAVLDPLGLLIAETAENASDPDVLFDGTRFVVVWADGRPRAGADIYGARVATDGTVLDPEGFAVCTATGSQTAPSLAFDGTNYLVAFEDDRGPAVQTDIYAARFDSAGTALDPDGVLVVVEGSHPAAAFGSSRYLVTWDSSGDVEGARIDPDGRVVDTTALPIASSAETENASDVAFDGTNWLVVWRRRTSVRGSLVDADGRTAGSLVITGSDFLREPSVAFAAGEYLVTWRDSTRVSAARVSTSAIALAGVTRVSVGANGALDPVVTHDGTQWLVLWYEFRRPGGVRGARLAPDGSLIDDPNLDISIGGHLQRNIATAFGDSEWLAVWVTRADNRESYRLVGTRVALDGTILDPAGIEIAPSIRAGDVALAHGAGQWLVTWTSTDLNLHGMRVDASGSAVGTRIIISNAAGLQHSPSVAFGGRDWLVAFEDRRSGVLFDSDIYGCRVATDGTVLDPAGIAIENTPDSDSHPSLASDGTHWLVAWDHSTDRGFNKSLWVRRVDADGRSPEIAISPAGGRDPAVAFDGTEWLVAFGDRTGGRDDLRAVRVRAPLVIVDSSPIEVSSGPQDETFPTATHDGTTWVVAWADERAFPRAADLYGARIDAAGGVLDPAAFVISSARGEERFPSISSDGAGNVLVAYTRHEGSTIRAYVRLLGQCDPTASDDATCDGADDDCDGAVDEDFAGVSTSCGIGACMASGMSMCVGGLVEDGCAPGTPSADDATCDGTDDDCDGNTDEGYVPVITACASGEEASSLCVAGAVDDGCSSSGSDGGAPIGDGGVSIDAGPADGGGSGCGCRAAGQSGDPAALALLAALLLLRRRRASFFGQR